MKIENILSVKLENLTFSLDDNKLKESTGSNIPVGIHFGVSENLKKNNDGVYMSSILFSLVLGEEAVEAAEKNKDNLEIEGPGMSVEYSLRFSSKEELIKVEDDLRDEIYAVMEPFVREKVSYLFSESNHGIPPIPYHFWK